MRDIGKHILRFLESYGIDGRVVLLFLGIGLLLFEIRHRKEWIVMKGFEKTMMVSRYIAVVILIVGMILLLLFK